MYSRGVTSTCGPSERQFTATALLHMMMHFQTGFNETRMGKKWDLTMEKPSTLLRFKVLDISMTM